jgi:isopentenyl phosphate kinase
MDLVKLGGSLITYKGSDVKPPYCWNETSWSYRLKENRLRELGRVLQSRADKGLILIHGGGTHGHRTVLRWKMGVARGKEAMTAWEVKWRMEQLTESLLRILGRERVPVISISPSDIMEANSGSIVSLDLRPIKKVLDRGGVPLLRGDFVPDEGGGWSVVSGDELSARICSDGPGSVLGKVDRAIMCMEEDGFLLPDGKGGMTPVGTITPEMVHSQWESWNEMIDAKGGASDASGGILGKVLACHRIAASGTEARIIGGDIGRNLALALSGSTTGTLFGPFAGERTCQKGSCLVSH